VGERQIVLSHLPMFMSPHNAQVVLEASFVKDGKPVDDVYFADRAANRSVRFYTVKPEPFAIQELFQSDPAHALRTRFKAITVFRGHLEKNGVPIDSLQDIDVQIKRIVHAHSFAGDKLPALTYVLFGGDQELFLAHLISRAPDFDQILSVSASGELPSAEELQRGVQIEVPGRPNRPPDRLKPSEPVQARSLNDAHPKPNLATKAELYYATARRST